MMQYIEPNDYDASVHREIIDAITREDNSILDICEDRAIEEMKSYMAGRYDVDRIFAARGEERASADPYDVPGYSGIPYLFAGQSRENVFFEGKSL